MMYYVYFAAFLLFVVSAAFADRAEDVAAADALVVELGAADSVHRKLIAAELLREKLGVLYRSESDPERESAEVEATRLQAYTSALASFSTSLGEDFSVAAMVEDERSGDPVPPKYRVAKRAAFSRAREAPPKVIVYHASCYDEDISTLEHLARLSGPDKLAVETNFVSMCDGLVFEGSEDSLRAAEALLRYGLGSTQRTAVAEGWLARGFCGFRAISNLRSSANAGLDDAFASALLATESGQELAPAPLIASIRPSPALVDDLFARAHDGLLRGVGSGRSFTQRGGLIAGDMGFVLGLPEGGTAYRHLGDPALITSLEQQFNADDSVYSQFALGLSSLDTDSQRFLNTLTDALVSKSSLWTDFSEQFGTLNEIAERRKELRVSQADLIYFAFCPSSVFAADPDLMMKVQSYLKWSRAEGLPQATASERALCRIRAIDFIPKATLNEAAAFSICWRTGGDINGLLTGSQFGLGLTNRALSLEGGSSQRPMPGRSGADSYRRLLAGGRVPAYSGEPPTALQNGSYLTFADWPSSSYALSHVPDLVADLNSKPSLLLLAFDSFMGIATQSGTFLATSDFKDFLREIVDGIVEAQDDNLLQREQKNEILKLMSAQLLHVHHSDSYGSVSVKGIFNQHYLVGDRQWGRALEVLLLMDPTDPDLDQFAAKILASGSSGKDFVNWLLSVRRGTPAPFAADSYLDVFENSDFNDLAIGLARAGASASVYLDDLRDPRLVGRRSVSVSFSRSRVSDCASFQLLALLGAIDRIEWEADSMPTTIPRPAYD